MHAFGINWVEPLTLASVAAGADGLMIEFHPDPRNAAVDPLQPITFEEFEILVKKNKRISIIIPKKII